MGRQETPEGLPIVTYSAVENFKKMAVGHLEVRDDLDAIIADFVGQLEKVQPELYHALQTSYGQLNKRPVEDFVLGAYLTYCLLAEEARLRNKKRS